MDDDRTPAPAQEQGQHLHAGDLLIDDWQQKIHLWATATFPGHSRASLWAHLLYEVVELGQALGVSEGQADYALDQAIKGYDGTRRMAGDELGDVGILWLALAGFTGYSAAACLHREHEKNLLRTWKTEPDGLGVHEHA